MQNSNNTINSSVEIDLFEVTAAVWKRKWLVVGMTLAVGFAAAAYAFFSTPIYESKYYISPPTVNDIANLNFGRASKSDLIPISVDQVYKVFLRNLQSESQRRAFFETTYLPSLGERVPQSPNGALYTTFSKNLTVAPVGKEEDGRWSVSLQDSSPERAVQWVDSYVSQVGASTARELTQNAKKEAAVLKRGLQLEIDTLRESSHNVRQDTISKIREALVIAKSSGLENTVVFSGSGSDKLAGSMLEGNSYLRGSKALEAELKNLENRGSDDPFTPGLRKLQKRADFYKQVEAEKFDIAVYRHDGVLDLPVSPVKPKKVLIVFLGLVIGGLLGSAIALLQHFITKRRRAESSETLGVNGRF
ncbi:LPS O-antigen chain length determinant protein WzzB [Pseudomonas sp. URMO17WK12:I12]|jgi:chain length determinant protein (polysaccharide antigen chain regulator)|uniref:LPS O-antigen chain length determinant protein WzzB n=1 Tax=Pseudomonas sp. URMO17WK12:I12 TaxID=1259797 RepID=UPI0004854E10|nr:Wzz/FepE/Etk N-terminal domain-containing protein [Pseudomonas sp. URMO17WK12:I12]